MLRFAQLQTNVSFASVLLAGVLLALNASLVRGEEMNFSLAMQMLDGKDSIKAADAAWWLGKQRTNDPEAIELLLKHVSDERPSESEKNHHGPIGISPVGDAAASALFLIGKPAVKKMAEYVAGDANIDSKVRILRKLGWMEGEAKEAFPVLVKLTTSENLDLRLHAFEAIGPVASDPQALLAVLQRGIRDENPDIQARALQGLRYTGTAAKILIPELVKILESTESRGAGAADFGGWQPLSIDSLEALAELGSAATAALPSVGIKFEDMDGRVRVAAAYAHAAISKEQDPGLDVLLKEMKNQANGRQRAEDHAARYLVELAKGGLFAEELYPAFKEGLQHRSSLVQVRAMQGIIRLRPAEAEKFLGPFAENKDSFVRDEAVRLLKELKNPDPLKQMK